MSKPWERQEEETDKAFAAFCIYRDMGAGRSLAGAWQKQRKDGGKTAEKTTNPPRYWEQWSSLYSWSARAVAYDEHLAAVAVTAAEDNVRALAAAYRQRILVEAAEMAAVGRDMVREAKGMEDRVGASLVAQRGVSIWEKSRQVEGMALGIAVNGQ